MYTVIRYPITRYYWGRYNIFCYLGGECFTLLYYIDIIIYEYCNLYIIIITKRTYRISEMTFVNFIVLHYTLFVSTFLQNIEYRCV